MTRTEKMLAFVDFMKKRNLMEAYKSVLHNVYHRLLSEHLGVFPEEEWVLSVIGGVKYSDWHTRWKYVHHEWLDFLNSTEKKTTEGCNSIW